MSDRKASVRRPKFLGLLVVAVLVSSPVFTGGDLGVPTGDMCGSGGGAVAADGLHCVGGKFDGKTILL
jgi:hypothetical protein